MLSPLKHVKTENAGTEYLSAKKKDWRTVLDIRAKRLSLIILTRIDVRVSLSLQAKRGTSHGSRTLGAVSSPEPSPCFLGFRSQSGLMVKHLQRNLRSPE